MTIQRCSGRGAGVRDGARTTGACTNATSGVRKASTARRSSSTASGARSGAVSTT